MESQKTLNNNIVNNILSFLMDIYTPSYDQQFKSYKIWKLTELLKIDSRQNRVTRVLRSGNHTETQTHCTLSSFPHTLTRFTQVS
jgi:hypothetical protein